MIIEKLIISGVFIVLVSGCSGRYIEVHSQNEIPQGPGMFSGSNGQFSYSKSVGKKADTTHKTVSKMNTVMPLNVAEDVKMYEQFKAFQAFRKEQEQHSLQYQQFQEWLRWKSYQ